jgi:hypothetical protein
MNRLILLVAAGMIHAPGIFAQFGNLTGKIVDQSSRLVIPFGSVRLSKDGKIAGTATANIDGQYKLEKIPSGTYSLQVSCVGYDSLHISDVTINENRKLTMNLEVPPRNNLITEMIPIPLYVPKKDSTKQIPRDTVNPKPLRKKQNRPT